jgi:hypothetical protein
MLFQPIDVSPACPLPVVHQTVHRLTEVSPHSAQPDEYPENGEGFLFDLKKGFGIVSGAILRRDEYRDHDCRQFSVLIVHDIR